MPKFSILIPAFKSAFLGECLSSVIAQNFTDWEAVVVDDASPEALRPIVEGFGDSRIRYFRNEKGFGAKNVVGNWNRCLDYAEGEFALCIGDDDRLRPNCLDIYNSLIAKYPDLDVYHTRTAYIDENSRLIGEQPPRQERESVYGMMWGRWQGRTQFIGDFLFRVSALRSQGGFYFLPYAWSADDISTYRAAEGKGIANSVGIGFEYRFNSLTISNNPALSIAKAEALRESRSWYEAFLSREASSDVETWKKLCLGLDDFMINFYLHHVKDDVRSRPLGAFLYWNCRRREFGIPFLRLNYVMLRALAVKYLHR